MKAVHPRFLCASPSLTWLLFGFHSVRMRENGPAIHCWETDVPLSVKSRRDGRGLSQFQGFQSSLQDLEKGAVAPFPGVNSWAILIRPFQGEKLALNTGLQYRCSIIREGLFKF